MKKQVKKQGQTTFFGLCLLAVAAAAIAAGGKGHAVLGAAPASSSGGVQGRGGGSGRHDPRLDARKAPPMARDRQVTEQDCSKPLAVSGGNLKCK
jgi:hypothetical protein